ncbi:MAG: Hsp20 family protein [Minwuia sp.]|nr:Hsp20 family protein [Minwuia sp.]
MRTFDLSPLLRNTVGFDRFDRLFDTAYNATDGQSFPAYDIVRRNDDSYRITLAVAGYGADELDINQEGRALTVTGKAEDEAATAEGGAEAPAFLHRGIARRAFTRRFHLADTVKVTGADLQNGLLHIELVNEIPEAEKPRTISIGSAQKQLSQAA